MTLCLIDTRDIRAALRPPSSGTPRWQNGIPSALDCARLREQARMCPKVTPPFRDLNSLNLLETGDEVAGLTGMICAYCPGPVAVASFSAFAFGRDIPTYQHLGESGDLAAVCKALDSRMRIAGYDQSGQYLSTGDIEQAIRRRMGLSL